LFDIPRLAPADEIPLWPTMPELDHLDTEQIDGGNWFDELNLTD
jgi:hypothetical protein